MPPVPDDSDADDISDNGLMEMVEVAISNDDELIEGVEDIDFNDGEDEGDIEILDESELTFQKHNGSVFTLDISKTNTPLVVSGGEDDKGYVWEMVSGDVLFECNGHKDSVTCSGFCADGKYVMTADMGGTVVVHETSSGKKIWDYECSEIEWCQWHLSAYVLFGGTTVGDIYMWKIPDGECKIYPTHGSNSTCGHIISNGKEMLVGYEDGSVRKWDLKNVKSIYHIKEDCDNENGVLCLASQKIGNLIAYGRIDGSVQVHNLSSGKHIASFTIPTNSNELDSMDDDDMSGLSTAECMEFSPCGSFIVVGSLNGVLCIWDIATQRMRHECRNPAGVNKILWDTKSDHVIAACLDGIIRVFEPKNGELFKEYYGGHMSNILDIVMSQDNKYIVTAGDDHCVRLFSK